MKRRELITLVCGAAAWPLAALAQQAERMRRVAVLMAYDESDQEAKARVAMFREGLQELGWTDGRNIQINIRWATGAEKISRLAQELAASQPDVVLSSTTPTTEAPLRQTRTILCLP
jgi:putative ABC transport system substrate-binding protein